MDKMVAERHRLMTPDQRMRIASSMFETARAIIESSLPLNLTRRERRLAFDKRLYADELPDAALLAFAKWNCGRDEIPNPLAGHCFRALCARVTDAFAVWLDTPFSDPGATP